MKKLHIGQAALIAVLAALTLLFGFVSVLSLIPVNTAVEIKETVAVSSSMVNSADKAYLVELRGSLRNTTSDPVTVERLEIAVLSEGEDEKSFTVVQEQLTLSARSEQEISVIVEKDAAARAVGEIRAVIGGEEVYLRNPAGTDLSSAILPILGTLVCAFFLVRACKVRYYMAQEDRMDAEAE